MNPELQGRLRAALERPHRLGMIGGDLEDQLAHCASFSSVLEANLLPGASTAVDLGTGGGLPGVALAAAFPDLRWTLVEIRTSRALEVERAMSRGQVNAEVCTSPAQTLGHDPDFRESFDMAVARALGPPSMTAECAAGLVRVGGTLIVSEPPGDDSPDGRWPDGRWPPESTAALGWSNIRTESRGNHRFVVMTKESPLSSGLPRRQAKALHQWTKA